MKPPSGELFRLLSAEGSGEGDKPDSRLQRWGEAFDAWLADRYSRFSPNVGPDSHRAWVEFLAFAHKPPWEIQVSDLEAYIEELQGRGLSAGTIQKRMTGLKSFYAYCQEKGPAHS
ncbi:MAG: site-specific integrase, partial [Anaerolineales bacterium]